MFAIYEVNDKRLVAVVICKWNGYGACDRISFRIELWLWYAIFGNILHTHGQTQTSGQTDAHAHLAVEIRPCGQMVSEAGSHHAQRPDSDHSSIIRCGFWEWTLNHWETPPSLEPPHSRKGKARYDEPNCVRFNINREPITLSNQKTLKSSMRVSLYKESEPHHPGIHDWFLFKLSAF